MWDVISMVVVFLCVGLQWGEGDVPECTKVLPLVLPLDLANLQLLRSEFLRLSSIPCISSAMRDHHHRFFRPRARDFQEARVNLSQCHRLRSTQASFSAYTYHVFDVSSQQAVYAWRGLLLVAREHVVKSHSSLALETRSPGPPGTAWSTRKATVKRHLHQFTLRKPM